MIKKVYDKLVRLLVYVIERRYIGAAEVALPLTVCVNYELKLDGMNIRFLHVRLVVNLRRTKMSVAYKVLAPKLQGPSSRLIVIGLPNTNTVVVG